MKYSLLILIPLLLISWIALGQIDSSKASVCGFGLLWQQQRARDPLFVQRLNQSEATFQQQIARQRGARVAQETVYTLPVVVHVIHNGESIGSANNPSDASIQAMIGVLNAGFRKSFPQSGGVDIGIQFQLAMRSPQCGSTSGINRVNGSSVTNYTSGGIAIGTYGGSADEVAVKSLSRWPNTDYINIWIVNKINGDANAGGFAFFPEYNSALNDGIVVCAGTVTSTNKTIVHEMGHVFNLYHTFHDYDNGNETTCPPSTSCTTTGDRVCDTEPVLNSTCGVTSNTCTGAAFQIADASMNYTVLNNYMGYTSCQWMFTQGQKDRMRTALLAFRGGLLSSGALSAPAASPPTVCSVSAANGLSPYYGVGRLTFNTLDVYSNSSMADGAFYVDRTCNQRTTLTAGQSYSLAVQGTYNNYQYLRAYVDYNADGDFNDAGETLMTTSAGSATVIVTVPAAVNVKINTPLRLRIIADNPNPTGQAPTPCNLVGTSSVNEGVGQVEDYTVVVQRRTVISVASGSWATPATWSCTCVPTSADIVSVQSGHIVSISSGMKQALNLTLQGRLQYAVGGQLQLTGN
ncbi:hypothetical protein GO755_25295 [Spirosoma sp. HMF4905]|uniref:Peptidase M43 pregnancy-associated plasma-A domain-containing protein n=1 Tax=Spirosoma arboris TaxID=2682092 RepID=A0A7K1SHT9_9BACT|nr:M43 family zinc metalloprotease [Spirosoma arboris]MVM33381.1 hypothetical protein [Spirosoma arboris]